MSAPDPFDYPDDPPPAPPARPPVDHDDDETAFWRGLREGSDRPPPPAEHRVDHAAYVEWMASERRVAYTVRCPDCMMDVKVPCVRIDQHGRVIVPHQPLRKLPAHTRRIQLARKAATR